MGINLQNQIIKTQDEDFEKFQRWFVADFMGRNGGFCPTDLLRWHTKVSKAHASLRHKMKCVKAQALIKLTSGQKIPSEQVIKPIADKIQKLIPEYLTHYSFEPNIFQNPLIPSINHGTHKTVKLTKHIANFTLENFGANKTREVDKHLSELGNIWSKYKTSDTELEITFSTTAKGFSLLGHYGPDKDSCFRQQSDKTTDKFTLGQTKDTFIITIAKFDKDKNKYKNVARCFGFANNNFQAFNLCNYYFKNTFREGDALESIKFFLEQLFDIKLTLHSKLIKITDGVYHNPYGNWSFLTENYAGGSQVLRPDQFGITLFKCERCRTVSSNYIHWCNIDDLLVCQDCIGKASVCGLTAKRTFKNLVKVTIKNGLEINIHPDYVDSNFDKCKDCKEYHEVLFSHQGVQNICQDCLDSLYVECDSCRKIFNEDCINEVFGVEICDDCWYNGNFDFTEEEENLLESKYEEYEITSEKMADDESVTSGS